MINESAVDTTAATPMINESVVTKSSPTKSLNAIIDMTPKASVLALPPLKAGFEQSTSSQNGHGRMKYLL